MKLLTEATKRQFRKIDLRYIEKQIVEIKTRMTPSGIPQTTLRIFEDSIDGLGVRPNQTAMDLPKRFFEKRQIKDNLWHFPLTDSNVTLLFHIWPNNQIRFKDKSSKQKCLEIIALTFRQDMNAKVISAYESGKVVPLDDFIEGKFELLPFQKVARHCSVKSGSFALYMEQGTGKTAVAVSSVVNDVLLKNIDFARVIIVCPKAVRTNWENELEKFVPKDMVHKVTIIRGTKIDRERLILEGIAQSPAKERISFVICSYGGLWSTQEALCLKKLAGLDLDGSLKWNWAILDESHYIKSPKTKRTKSCHVLRDASNNRLVLTGTPYVNSLFDLWSQWEFLGKYHSGFSNFNSFKDFHAKYATNSQGRRVLEDFENIPLLKERLARTSYLIKKEEALPDLPEKVFDIVECEMSKEQVNFYNKVLTQIYLEIEADAKSDLPKEMTVNNILTKLLRLSQVTSGFKVFDKVYDDFGKQIGGGEIDRFDPNNKLEMLVSLIKANLSDSTNNKTIIWSRWIPSIKQIRARLNDIEGIKTVAYHGGLKDDVRENSKNSFNNDPEVKVLIGNPAAGGVGLNLLGYDPERPDDYETNCNHKIYYSMGWSLAERLQSLARAHRKGTRVPLRITDLIVPGTIDMEIKKRVDDKAKTALNLTDIKEILQHIRVKVKVEVD